MALLGKHRRGMTDAKTAFAKPRTSKAAKTATAPKAKASSARVAAKPAMRGETGSAGRPMRPKSRPAAPMSSPRPKSVSVGSTGPSARRGSSKGKREAVSFGGIKLPGLGTRAKPNRRATGGGKENRRKRGKYGS